MAKTHCLNCGNDFEDEFCPKCGQSAKVKRLTFRGVFIESAWDILSMDSGMFYTMFMLVTKPWKVISEYIRGRRKSYTKPVQLMLVTIVLLAVVQSIPGMSGIADEMSNSLSLNSSHASGAGVVWDYFVRFVCESKMTQEIIIGFFSSITCWLVYLPFGSRRYNLVEYCCAYFYWSAMTNIIHIVTAPLYFIGEYLSDSVEALWIIVLSATLVTRAFPIRRRWLHIILLGIAATVMFLVIVFFLGFAISIDTILK